MTFEERLKARIAADGPMPLDLFFAESTQAYYAGRDPFGSDGDFTTAPEISQMFGELVGACLTDLWMRGGASEKTIYAEAGPGRGTLAHDALRVMRMAGFAGEIHLVETSPSLRKQQRDRLGHVVFHDHVGTLPPVPTLFVANEFFDALPVRQTVDGDPRLVAIEDGTLVFKPANGTIVETSPARSSMMALVARHLAHHGGAGIVIDYGYAQGETGDTLQAVKDHETVDPLAFPGAADLTAHVDFQALSDAAESQGLMATRIISQGSWLEALGLSPRASALAAKNPERTGEIAAQRRRLADADEMGQLFKVLGLHHAEWPAPAGFPS